MQGADIHTVAQLLGHKDLRMAARYRSLDSQSKRARLPFRHAPYWNWLSQGCYLGYRKNNRACTWIAKQYNPSGKPRLREHLIGCADDYLPADGIAVLNYEQALEKARVWFATERAIANGTAPKPTAYAVSDATREYMVEYERRGKRNAGRTLAVINAHIIPALGNIRVENSPAMTTANGWNHWCNLQLGAVVSAAVRRPSDPRRARKRKNAAAETPRTAS